MTVGHRLSFEALELQYAAVALKAARFMRDPSTGEGNELSYWEILEQNDVARFEPSSLSYPAPHLDGFCAAVTAVRNENT